MPDGTIAKAKKMQARSASGKDLAPPPTEQSPGPGLKGLISWEQHRKEIEIEWRKAIPDVAAGDVKVGGRPKLAELK